MAPLRALGPDGPLLPVLNGVPLVRQFRPLGQQALTTPLAAMLENAPPCLGGHAGPEAVLALADAFGGLICALAHGFQAVLGLRPLPGGGRLSAAPHLSMRQGTFRLQNTKNLPPGPSPISDGRIRGKFPDQSSVPGGPGEKSRLAEEAGRTLAKHYASRSLLHEEATGLFHVLVTTPREVRDNHIARR